MAGAGQDREPVGEPAGRAAGGAAAAPGTTATAPPATGQGSAELTARLRGALANPKYLITFLITLILVLGEYQYAILGGYDRLVTALTACLVTESVLARIYRGRFVGLSSAYISGISLSLLTKPQASILWPFALGGFLAIASKYVLTYRDRHLWNPSNFAISVLVLLAPSQVTILSHQWGNDLATNMVIWAFGLAIVWRAGVLHVTLTYLGSFATLAVVRNLIVGGPLLAEIAPITGPMYQLFIFFMITDPRTTVDSRRGRMVVAGAIAVVETAIRLGGDFGVTPLRPLLWSPPIFSLFLVGPVAMWIDLRRRMSNGVSARRRGETVDSREDHEHGKVER